MITAWRDAKSKGLPPGLRRLEYQSAVDGVADWALIQPPTNGTRWIVCIHGHGSSGDQLWTSSLTRPWLPVFQKRGSGILSPHLRGNAWMGPAAAADLHWLLKVVRAEFSATHFDFVSGSMGGTSNLIYAGLHPADAASVVALGPATDLATYLHWCRQKPAPILTEIADAIETAYGGSPATKSAMLTAHSPLANARHLTMPLYLAHGEADAIIPVTQSRKFASVLTCSPVFQYEEIPGGDHDAPIPAAARALDWVLSKS